MSHLMSTSTNKLPLLGAGAFVCAHDGRTSGLPLAQRRPSPMVRYQWIKGNEDQVHPGEGVA